MPRPLPAHVLAATAGDDEAVRGHILDAANRVIAERGLAAASTRAIAEEAGLSVGTLYNYFDDRLQLLAQSILRRAHIRSRSLAELPSQAGTGTVRDNLRRFGGEIAAILDELVPLFAAAFSNADLLDSIRWEATSGEPPGGPFANHPVKRYLVAERELGRVAAEADCDAAASLVLSLCHDRAFHHFFRGQPGKSGSITREIDLIAGAIAAPGQAPAEASAVPDPTPTEGNP